MATSFIGRPIALTSHSDVRYRGILAGIDTQASTIQLSNVYSLGTESRRPPHQFIPPVPDPYEYIIFRASEVKDLALDEGNSAPSRPDVREDPAVIGIGASAPPQIQPRQQAPQPSFQQPQQQQQQPPPQPQHQQHQHRQPASSATSALQSVERALGDLRVSQAKAARGGRRGGGDRSGAGAAGVGINVPDTDFDFAAGNAKFDKAALSPTPKDADEEVEEQNGDVDGKDKKSPTLVAYNPKNSFFDALTPGETPTVPSGGGGRGRGRGGPGNAASRSRREEERERNMSTFGEPGGVGLMGPGAYVGGWGSSRRGGGRGVGRGGHGHRGRGRGRRGEAPSQVVNGM